MADSTTTIETLEIQVESSADSAVTAIERLEKTLDKLQGVVKGGLSGLRTTAKQIDAFAQSIDDIPMSGIERLERLQSSLGTLKSIGNIKLTATINQLEKLPTTLGAFNNIDFDRVALGAERLASALTPLATQMERIGAGFAAMPKSIQQTITQTDRLSLSAKKNSASLGLQHVKLGIGLHSVIRLANGIGGLIDKSAEYAENANLFNVAMGEFAEEAKAYTDVVSEVMGIDPSEWMRNQGVFMTLADGFGVASDRAYLMSKNLTQLGYDISSFYNISVEEAMQKLKSGFAGELEPLALAA